MKRVLLEEGGECVDVESAPRLWWGRGVDAMAGGPVNGMNVAKAAGKSSVSVIEITLRARDTE